MTLQLVPVLVLLGIPGSFGLWTVDKLTTRSGSSITIPCHYHRMFRQHVKYWCRGKFWGMCMPVRESRGRVSIKDSPAEQVVTLTLSNLQNRDAGRYWCAIKIQGFMKADARTSLELLVTKDAVDLWVNNSTVSGPEGGNVSIECFYSDKLKDTEKKWCRSGDLHSCQSEHDIQPSQPAQLHLSDDDRGCFNVTLVGLQTVDAGWYWCMAAGIQALVHLTVTEAPTTPKGTGFSEMTSLQTSVASINASTPPSASPLLTFTPSTSAPLISSEKPEKFTPVTEPRTTSSAMLDHSRTSSSVTPGSPECTSTIWSAFSMAALTIHPSAAPSVTSNLHIWLMVLVTGSMLLIAATVTTLVWRWQLQRSQTHMIEDRTESAQNNVMDDVDLIDYEWTSNSVLDMDEEPTTTQLL